MVSDEAKDNLVAWQKAKGLSRQDDAVDEILLNLEVKNDG